MVEKIPLSPRPWHRAAAAVLPDAAAEQVHRAGTAVCRSLGVKQHRIDRVSQEPDIDYARVLIGARRVLGVFECSPEDNDGGGFGLSLLQLHSELTLEYVEEFMDT